MEALMVGKEGEVIAIEPFLRYETFERNVALNDQKNIQIVNAAVSDTDGSKTFSFLTK